MKGKSKIPWSLISAACATENFDRADAWCALCVFVLVGSGRPGSVDGNSVGCVMVKSMARHFAGVGVGGGARCSPTSAGRRPGWFGSSPGGSSSTSKWLLVMPEIGPTCKVF